MLEQFTFFNVVQFLAMLTILLLTFVPVPVIRFDSGINLGRIIRYLFPAPDPSEWDEARLRQYLNDRLGRSSIQIVNEAPGYYLADRFADLIQRQMYTPSRNVVALDGIAQVRISIPDLTGANKVFLRISIFRGTMTKFYQTPSASEDFGGSNPEDVIRLAAKYLADQIPKLMRQNLAV